MRKSPRRCNVEQVARVVDEDLRNDVQAKQIDELLIAWRKGLSEPSCEGETRKHFHEVVMGAAEAKGEADKAIDVLARICAWSKCCATSFLKALITYDYCQVHLS